MKNELKGQIETEARTLHHAGHWQGRQSAVVIAKKLGIASTSTVLKIAEAAIAEVVQQEPDHEPDVDDSVKCCPDCERPNQFGEVCPECSRDRATEAACANE